MSNKKFPDEGTPLYDQIKSRVESGEDYRLIAADLGMTMKGLKDAVYSHGMSRKVILPEVKTEENVVYKSYPNLKIKPIPTVGKKRDEEDICIVRADAHTGKKTISYDLDIYRKRVERLLDKVMRIIELHKPIKKIWVFYVGDCVQGENPYQGSKLEETECGAYTQIHDYAVPTESRFLLSLSQYAKVEAVCVPGNHGIYGREATKRTNWDNFFYKALADANVEQKYLDIVQPTQFYQLVNIYGYRFFLFHGDQVRATSGIPLFALRRKLNDWYAYAGGFHYAYGGHFHTWGADTINSASDYQLCPPLVTGDEWALQVVGRASWPIQLVFGVHPRQGRTWEYKLYCDNDFLPKPIV